MKNNYFWLVILFVFSLVSISYPQIYSEKESIVPEIQKGSFDKELVRLEGVVVYWENVPQKTTVRYWLRDYWGNIIPIQSTQEHPIVNVKYRIEGTVQISAKRLSYKYVRTYRFIDEHSRVQLDNISSNNPVLLSIDKEQSKTEESLIATSKMINNRSNEWWYDFSKSKNLLSQANTNLQNKNFKLALQNSAKAQEALTNPQFSKLFYLAIILLVLIIAIIIAVLMLFVKKQPKQTKDYSGMSRNINDQIEPTIKSPTPTQTVGETVKMTIPPPGTLKVLKGRMEIVDGETQLKEIRFYSLPQQTSLEFSFGRNPGEPYKHIQVNHPTVSRDQARLLYNNGSYTLINKADPVSKNATKINDEEIPINEARILKDGDKITMGVVSMIYREN